MSYSGNFSDAVGEVEYAYENAKFFRHHMKQHDLMPSDIKTIADFQKIPFTRKLHYRKNYPIGVLAKGFTLMDKHVMRFQSSGTSGERLNSAILSYDLARRQATVMSTNERFRELWAPGERPRICRYAPPNCSDVECGIGLSSMEERTLEDGTLVLSVAHDLLATPERLIHQALDEIEAYNPHILVVDPTHLAFLIRRACELGRDIHSNEKLHIVCGYTQLTHVARRQIEDYFGQDVPIGNMLGMSELGYLGFECHHGNLHINNEDFFIEFFNDDSPAPIDEAGELVVTTIDDTLVPRIRYATGDIYRLLSESCECGSHLPRVMIEGRQSHVIHLSNGKSVTPTELDAQVGACQGIDLYKLDQSSDGTIAFQYIPNEQFTENMRADLEEALRDCLQLEPSQMAMVDYIACERSGKFQSCISRLGE
ncbi:phenylacetate--CoA ligase family protein [Vibrio coralliilyticus]|uniref:phenylacetate--CoA ligase family protein n=1 Tax=Vibrio coralliilyticus TaxID=190893 RepID=UPI000C1716AD|nr:phenylacetate--CoA ligase family protein [Vibrio coralliilyticus]